MCRYNGRNESTTVPDGWTYIKNIHHTPRVVTPTEEAWANSKVWRLPSEAKYHIIECSKAWKSIWRVTSPLSCACEGTDLEVPGQSGVHHALRKDLFR